MRAVKTLSLRVTVGAYSDGTWHCSLVEDSYERGRPLGSEMIAVQWGTEDKMRRLVERALDALVEREHARVENEREAADSLQ